MYFLGVAIFSLFMYLCVLLSYEHAHFNLYTYLETTGILFMDSSYLHLGYFQKCFMLLQLHDII